MNFYLPSCSFWLSPMSTRGLLTSISAPGASGFGFSFWTEFPEAISSCLASRRCKSSFSAKPCCRSDSSLNANKGSDQWYHLMTWQYWTLTILNSHFFNLENFDKIGSRRASSCHKVLNLQYIIKLPSRSSQITSLCVYLQIPITSRKKKWTQKR